MNLLCDIEEFLVAFQDLPSCLNPKLLEDGHHSLQDLRHPPSKPRGIDVKKGFSGQPFTKPLQEQKVTPRRNSRIIGDHDDISSMAFLTSSSTATAMCTLIPSRVCMNGSIERIFSPGPRGRGRRRTTSKNHLFHP